jgi:hypothetical protein
MLLHINGNHLFYHKLSFLTDPYCQFKSEYQCMKQSNLYWYITIKHKLHCCQCMKQSNLYWYITIKHKLQCCQCMKQSNLYWYITIKHKLQCSIDFLFRNVGQKVWEMEEKRKQTTKEGNSKI